MAALFRAYEGLLTGTYQQLSKLSFLRGAVEIDLRINCR